MNMNSGQQSNGGGGRETFGGSNTYETFTFGSSRNESNNYRQNPPRPNSAADFSDQVFQVRTGEPTSHATRTNNFSIGSGIARPNSAPMPNSFDQGFMGSNTETNFDFEAFKAKIQSGSFQQVRDELASMSSGGGSGENNSQDLYFKPTSEGRKKRSNSDPMGGESFFDAFTFGDVDDAVKEKRGRQKEVQDRSKAGPYKRSKSVDGVDQMANMAASLFPGFNCDSDHSDASEFDFKQDIEPIKVSLPNKPKRRSSEPLITADFFNDQTFDFEVLGQKAQDMFAFTMNFGSESEKPSRTEKKSSSRARSNSEPMFSEEFANAFGEGSVGGSSGAKEIPANVDLFDSIQDVLGLDGSDRPFDSDDEEEEQKKPSASNSIKRNNSAPLLASDFFETVFGAEVQKKQKQDDVEQDELDVFVKKMFSTEKTNQNQGSMPSLGMGDHQSHQRSRSMDAISSFNMMGNNMFNAGMQNIELAQAVNKLNPGREDSLSLYNMLFTEENNRAAQSSFNLMGMPQTMENQFGQQQMGNQIGRFNTNTSQGNNGGEDATFFVINAVKATHNQLQTLHPLVMKTGDTAAMEEVANAFAIAASATQYILSSDLPKAVAVLCRAQSTIETVWSKISGNVSGKGGRNKIVSGTEIFSSGFELTEGTPKHRDSDSVCSSVTGVSFASHSSTPPAMIPTEFNKSSDYDTKSVMSTKSTRSNRSIRSGSSRSRCPDLKDLPPQDDSNPDVIMARLKALMERTQYSQKKLQRWDKKNGLPKSHSQTMVNSSRSRKQLQEGVVLKKWNGVPLIGDKKGKGP
jgi:hypothetical protein